MDERDAIARLKAGDIGGLEVLVRRHQVEAVQAAYLITRDRSLAEDLVQGAFLRAYERIAQFDQTRPFRPWFVRSVVNDALKACTRRGRQVRLEGLADGRLDRATNGAHPDLEELVESAETQGQIRLALERLSPTLRAAIVERYFLGLTEAEMVQSAACPPGTIKRRLHDARARLRRLLGGPPGWWTVEKGDRESPLSCRGDVRKPGGTENG
jgi:RNA polymerase sigma-70 factor, ECF subfamily